MQLEVRHRDFLRAIGYIPMTYMLTTSFLGRIEMEQRRSRMDLYLSSPCLVFQGCFRAIFSSCRWKVPASVPVSAAGCADTELQD